MHSDEKSWSLTRMPNLRVMTGIATAFMMTAFVVAPSSAAADPTESLRAAIAAARGGASSCGPLRSDPTVDQVAAKVNESSDKWLDFAARAVPETDALPALKDFGYEASKSAILSSMTPDVGTAVKALVLQGFAKIPDCSLTSFGVATTFNARKQLYVMTAVLAG